MLRRLRVDLFLAFFGSCSLSSVKMTPFSHWPCQVCPGQSFVTLAELIKHGHKLHKLCTHCSTYFDTPNESIEHICIKENQHVEKVDVYECGDCGFKTRSKNNLETHQKSCDDNAVVTFKFCEFKAISTTSMIFEESA